MLGDRLLASKAYDSCSKNDTKLKELFERTSFWNHTGIKDIDGAPGLSSGVFDGKLSLDIKRNTFLIKDLHMHWACGMNYYHFWPLLHNLLASAQQMIYFCLCR